MPNNEPSENEMKDMLENVEKEVSKFQPKKDYDDDELEESIKEILQSNEFSVKQKTLAVMEVLKGFRELRASDGGYSPELIKFANELYSKTFGQNNPLEVNLQIEILNKKIELIENTKEELLEKQSSFKIEFASIANTDTYKAINAAFDKFKQATENPNKLSVPEMNQAFITLSNDLKAASKIMPPSLQKHPVKMWLEAMVQGIKSIFQPGGFTQGFDQYYKDAQTRAFERGAINSAIQTVSSLSMFKPEPRQESPQAPSVENDQQGPKPSKR